MSSSRKHPTTALVALVTGAIAATTALTACTTAQSAEEADTSNPQDTEHADHSDHDHGADNHAEPQGKEETDTYKPRIAVTYDGGIHILDASTLEEVADIPLDGFNRISATGNPRYLAVAASGGFRLLDMGTWTHKHCDHDHYYTAQPQLLDLLVPAEEPGHVIPKAENVTFFDDATGKAWTYTISDLGSSHDPVATYTAQSPHHGFAIQRADGSYVVTEGTHDERNTVNVAAADGKVLTSNSKCPGVHGEAVAAAETITVGCQDGILIVKDKTITKVDSPTDYGRIGNQAGVKDSPVVLGDYKSDKDSKTEQPTQVSLTDVEKETLTLVDLPASLLI
ncbi:hypothetical protein [Timonella sp. A28]|uniref:hypothetical protein n=1 Tax=Timonella sp. A28 TaxID=3442640 RepID=UPI003EBC5DE8